MHSSPQVQLPPYLRPGDPGWAGPEVKILSQSEVEAERGQSPGEAVSSLGKCREARSGERGHDVKKQLSDPPLVIRDNCVRER